MKTCTNYYYKIELTLNLDNKRIIIKPKQNTNTCQLVNYS